MPQALAGAVLALVLWVAQVLAAGFGALWLLAAWLGWLE